MDRAAAAVADAARALMAERGVDDAGIRAVAPRRDGEQRRRRASRRRAPRDARGRASRPFSSGETAHARGLELLRGAGGEVVSPVAAADAAETPRGRQPRDRRHRGPRGDGRASGSPPPRSSPRSRPPRRCSPLTSRAASTPTPARRTRRHVSAHATVSFTAPTACVLLPPAALAAGRVTFADVGVPAPPRVPGAPGRLTEAGVAALWPVPRRDGDKYSRGVVGVIAGSDLYPGAAILACSAAIHSGAGLVRYVGPRRVQDLVLAARPEVVAVGATPPPPPRRRVGARPGGRGRPRPGGRDPCGPRQRGSVRRRRRGNRGGRGGARGWTGSGGARTRRPPPDAPRGRARARALDRARRAASSTADAIAADPARAARTLAEATRATVLLKGAVTLVATPSGRSLEPGGRSAVARDRRRGRRARRDRRDAPRRGASRRPRPAPSRPPSTAAPLGSRRPVARWRPSTSPRRSPRSSRRSARRSARRCGRAAARSRVCEPVSDHHDRRVEIVVLDDGGRRARPPSCSRAVVAACARLGLDHEVPARREPRGRLGGDCGGGHRCRRRPPSRAIRCSWSRASGGMSAIASVGT